MNAKYRKIIIVNLIVSLCLILGLELGYRIILNRTVQAAGTPYYFFATNKPTFEMNPELGYDYIPNQVSHTAIVKMGQVVRLYTNRINSVGMTQSEGIYDPAAEVQIFAVGDSFTALPYVPKTWPEWMHDALEQDVAMGKSVSVFNGGRDGYGMLQMLHAARLHCETGEVDRVVLAFISDDLTRGRFWRYHLDDLQPPRIVTSVSSNPAELNAPYVDAYLLEPALTTEWVQQMLADPEQARSDPFLQGMVEEVKTRKAAFLTVPLFDFSTSVVWNQLKFGDPHHAVNQRGRNPRHQLSSFAQDPQCVEDLRVLTQSGIQIDLFHIPTRAELQEGAYSLSSQDHVLLESLETLTGRERVQVLPLLQIPEEDIDAHFLEPHDHHPNMDGMKLYGDTIAAWLLENRPKATTH